MAARCSTEEVVQITSAQKYTELRRFLETHELTDPSGVPTPRRSFRETDPASELIGDLSPEALGQRIVIRSRDFLGTVYGTLLAVDPHPTLAAFTTVQLFGKKALTFRNDTECLVVG